MFRALLVEDSASFRQTLANVLLTHFPIIGVLEAGDGEDAMRKVEFLNPDIVFMDVKLPGENGLEVTRKIRRVYPHVVIVVLSGYDLPEYRQVAARNGADCFISKGEASCMAEVLARVQSAMAGKTS